MRIELTDEHREFQEEARAWIHQTIGSRGGEFDRAQLLPEEVIAALGRNRLLGSTVDEKHGGRGLDMISYGILHQEIGAECSSTRSLLTVHDMVALAVERLGSSKVRDRWLPEFTSGSAIAAFALSEPEVGSDASSVQTNAVRDGASFVLSGTKKWISFGQRADVFLVLARDDRDGQVGGFLVPRESPGLEVEAIEGLLGLRASMLAELSLNECRVSDDSRVGSAALPNGLVTATALQLGRYSVAWGCVGIATACVAAAFAYTSERQQFGVPLREHQLVQRHLAGMLTDLEAARLLCLHAGALLESRDPRAVAATLMAKYFSSRAAARIASDAVQVHGAAGCRPDAPIERYYRDARMMEIIEGTNEILETVIPRYGPTQLSAEKTVEEAG